MADATRGVGIVITRTEQTVIAVMGASVVSFIILFAILALRQSNEVIIARRCIWWARLTIVPVFVCHAIQLHLDLEYYFGSFVALPSVAIVRPALGLVFAFVAFYINSHFVLRWLVVVLQPLFIVAALFTAAYMRVWIDCRAAGSCLIQGGISLQELRQYEIIQFIGAFFSLWLVLISAYLLIVMGVCSSRYSVRLFSMEVSLRGLASRRGAAAFERPQVDAQDVRVAGESQELEGAGIDCFSCYLSSRRMN
jgi:hypothetical protein